MLEVVYTITVPTTIYNKPADADLADSIRVEIKMALAKEFGGFTETQANGGWVSNGELIQEVVYVIQAFAAEPNDELVKALALKVKTAMKQEAVLITKNGSADFA